jgi:DNA repair exonuclease SbcCD ATPase subunit
MKKVLFAVIGFVMIGCTNPSMEEGLADLREKLAQVEAELVAVDVDGMLADLEEMNAQATQALADAEASNEALEAALVQVGNIKDRLQALQVLLDEAATVDQVQALKDKVAEISEGIAMLVFVADYDYDGVMNGLDQCPDTPITEINDVNGVGCSPSQIAG